MRKSLLYVPLDVNYDDDPKVIAAGEKAELLFIRGLVLAKRTLSDGFVSDLQLPRLGLSSVKQRAAKLVEVGLWERDDEAGGWWIVAWDKHNKSAAEVKELRAKRQQAGKLGGKRSGEARREANAKQVGSANAKQPANPEGSNREVIGKGSKKPLAPDKPARKPRAPDPIFDALIEACGLDPGELTDSARGAINKAAKELRSIDASPEGIRARAEVHRRRWPNAELTATSLAKNYALLGVSRPEPDSRPPWEREAEEARDAVFARLAAQEVGG